MRFCQTLKAARNGHSLTQAELAKRAGLHTNAISHFESGRRTPSLANIYKLMKVLGLIVVSGDKP